MWKRLVAVYVVFCVCFTLLYLRLFSISTNEEYAEIAQMQSGYTLTLGRTWGAIYDQDFRSLVNTDTKYMAAVYPTQEALTMLEEYAVNPDVLPVEEGQSTPFACEVSVPHIPCDDITVVEVPVRYEEQQTATHIIGYMSDGAGVSGLEFAFDSFLRENYSDTTITYRMDSWRNVIPGKDIVVDKSKYVSSGVVTTLDMDIQMICETAARKYMEKGAIVVMDPYTGEIQAMVSMPEFSPLDLTQSLTDTANTPMINRALLPYNLGSIFKLCTAAAALEQGVSPELTNNCTGSVMVGDQLFHCHDLNGHGELDMEGAIVESCNTYFINLVEQIDPQAFLNTASAFSFGRSTNLAAGLRAQAGYLQTTDDLINVAERANLSFGQGMLTATPIQVAQMTSAIVNGGKTPQAQLVIGLTEDGNSLSEELLEPAYTNAVSEKTAQMLMQFMRSMVKEETRVGVRPDTTTAGGKTATAQTGNFGEDGEEIIQGWFTGFTPAYKPNYVITVLVEDGGSGYTSAGPIFKYIADALQTLGK